MKVISRNVPGNYDTLSEKMMNVGSSMGIASFILDENGEKLVSYSENSREATYIVLDNVLVLEIIQDEGENMGRLSKVNKNSKEYNEEVIAYLDMNEEVKIEWEKESNDKIEKNIKDVVDFYKNKINGIIPHYRYYSA